MESLAKMAEVMNCPPAIQARERSPATARRGAVQKLDATRKCLSELVLAAFDLGANLEVMIHAHPSGLIPVEHGFGRHAIELQRPDLWQRSG